jgi:hypothetical protein
MLNPPASISQLSAIQQKVRRLTRSPSAAQLSDTDLNNYINTFVVYDFPEHLRTFNLRTTFTFETNPLQSEYPTDILSFGAATNAMANPLYDFQNKYLTVHPPVYIAGYHSLYTQSREQFFNIYPKTNNIASINNIGDNIATKFSGNILLNIQGQTLVNANLVNIQSACILQNEVLFSSVDLNGNGLAMVDVPVLDGGTGNPTIWGNLYPPTELPTTPPLITDYGTPGSIPTGVQLTNYINYYTGQFVVTFLAAPGNGLAINSQCVPTSVGLPQMLLFYDNHFVVRPVPDQPYRVQFEVYVRPDALLATNQQPQLNEYWQYIAYGSARKILQDRMDIETVNLIEPEYKKQENLCLRRTIVQYTNERTATIYAANVEGHSNNGNNGQGSGAF